MKRLLLIVLLAACSPQATTPTAVPATATREPGLSIVLGDINDDPEDTIEDFQPLADYLASQLGEFDITQGEVKVAPNTETMIEWLKAGEVDLYFDSAYPALIISNESGAKPILRRWRDGVAQYYTVMFTHERSGVRTLEELVGKRLALDEPLSTSGYMLPVAYLMQSGLPLVERADPEAEADPDKVNYIFTYDDDDILEWVTSGLVDAGAIDSGTFNAIPDETRNSLVIMAETETVPRQIAIAASDMDDDLVAAITTVLVGLDETDEGKVVLEAFDDTAQFDEFPEGIDKALNRMSELYALTQGVQE